jgi:hypothetical protein
MDGLDHVLLRGRLCVGFRAENFNLQTLVLLNICDEPGAAVTRRDGG